MSDSTHKEIDIKSDPETIMNVIADLPVYPTWAEGVKNVDVSETFPDGRPKTATFTFASGPINDVFTLEYEWNGNESVSWYLTEGQVLKKEEGTYALKDNGDGSIKVIYDLTVDISIPIPGMLKRGAEKKMVKSALDGLKKRVESL